MAVKKAAAHGDTDCSLLQAHKSYTCCIDRYIRNWEAKGRKEDYPLQWPFFNPSYRNQGFLDLILKALLWPSLFISSFVISCPGTQVLLPRVVLFIFARSCQDPHKHLPHFSSPQRGWGLQSTATTRQESFSSVHFSQKTICCFLCISYTHLECQLKEFRTS